MTLVSKAEMMRFVDMQRDFAEMLWNLDDDEQIVFATFSSSSED